MQKRVARKGDADEFLARFGLKHGERLPQNENWIWRKIYLYDGEGQFLGDCDLRMPSIVALVDGLQEGERVIGVDHRKARPIHRRLHEQAMEATEGVAPDGFCCHCGRSQDEEGRHFTDRDPGLALLAPVVLYIFDRGSYRVSVERRWNDKLDDPNDYHGIVQSNTVNPISETHVRVEGIWDEDVYSVLGVPSPELQPA